jgi:hypothetical protein
MLSNGVCLIQGQGQSVTMRLVGAKIEGISPPCSSTAEHVSFA